MNDLVVITVPPKAPKIKRPVGSRKKVIPAYEKQVETVGQVAAPGWVEILTEARLHLARALHQARTENDAEGLARVVSASCRAASSLVALEKLVSAELGDLSDEDLKAILKAAVK